MGLVGLDVHPGLTAAHVSSLVLLLDECDRTHAVGEAVAGRVAAVTGQRVKATLLKLDKLRLLSGKARPSGEFDPAAVLTDLFFERLGGGGGGGGGAGDGPGGGDAAELAKSFEGSLRVAGSEADWKLVIEAWNQGLLSIDPAHRAVDGGAAGAEDVGKRLEEIATFLRALSPLLCQRLLSGTVNHNATPASVALALVERLPLGIVLGALSEVDRSSAAPSAAAVAVLRKIAANVSPGQTAADGAPRSNAELAAVAETLQKLLGANQEEKFVPAEYFNRRQELSADALTPPPTAKALVVPTNQETSAHAAALAFGMLSSADASPAHFVSCLAFLKNHLDEWVRGGQFSLAEHGMECAQSLRAHAEPRVAEAAAELLSDTLDADVLLEGSRHPEDPAKAIGGIMKLLGQNDGAALLSILTSEHLPTAAAGGKREGGGGGGDNVVLEAVRQYLLSAGDGWIVRLFGRGQDRVPPGLANVLATMADADVFKVVRAVAPQAASAARRALVEIAYRRKGLWPVDFIERLLKDPEARVRRLAVMRLMRDADLATAAAFLDAASDSEPYHVDVAVGLSDLLHAQRRRPEVRGAYRKWFWSRRRWAGFFSFSMSLDHGRRAA
jgi:hypothetical protein